MKLSLIGQPSYMIVKFPANSPVPSNFHRIVGFKSVTYTQEECSIVVPEESLNTATALGVEKNWAIIQIVGPLDFSLVGILAQLTTPLAQHNISIFALSTFDTDYLLLKNTDLEKASDVLQQQGHEFI